MALACCLAVGTAFAADETWQLESARGKLGLHPELSRELGISVQPSQGPDAYQRIASVFEASGRMELRAPGSLFSDIGNGELHVTSTGVLRLRDTEIPLQSLVLQRGLDERTLAVVADDEMACGFIIESLSLRIAVRRTAPARAWGFAH